MSDTRADLTVLSWVAVALFFVVGDAVTTYAGLSVGAVEAHPVSDVTLTRAGVAGMVAAKIAVVGTAWVFFRRARAYPWAVPAALGAMGVAIVAWNLAVVAVLLVG